MIPPRGMTGSFACGANPTRGDKANAPGAVAQQSTRRFWEGYLVKGGGFSSAARVLDLPYLLYLVKSPAKGRGEGGPADASIDRHVLGAALVLAFVNPHGILPEPHRTIALLHLHRCVEPWSASHRYATSVPTCWLTCLCYTAVPSCKHDVGLWPRCASKLPPHPPPACTPASPPRSVAPPSSAACSKVLFLDRRPKDGQAKIGP
nr:hypothetical protein CFP56_50365 [Quercus suber]